MPLVAGLDVGTQGVRVVICDEEGTLISHASSGFGNDINVQTTDIGRFEQNPAAWWKATQNALASALRKLSASNYSPEDIKALAVDSTSGTIVCVDAKGDAVRPAIMYSDTRAKEESRECNAHGADLTDALGYKFSASFGLPKIQWVRKNEPGVWQKTEKAVHAADYITGKLTGCFSVTDNSNALKSGYDLIEDKWPGFIPDMLGISIDKLPHVISPGEHIATVSKQAAELTGLSTKTAVVGGVSDGTAGFISSGASEVGMYNSTLGTTLVIRGVSRGLVKDPLGRIYCHKHPDGYWLPGGASNVGGHCLAVKFDTADYSTLDEKAEDLIPTDAIIYPLARTGERFPFINPNAEGFYTQCCSSEYEEFAGCLEGVACVERWCYEVLESLGAEIGGEIRATGGGANSLLWMRIRASVTGRTYSRPRVTESAFGSAIVAASRKVYSSLSEAADSMVEIEMQVAPEKKLVEAYEEKYGIFRKECEERGLG